MRRFIISGAFFYQHKEAFLAQFPAVFSKVTAHTTILDQKTLCSTMSQLPVQKSPENNNILISFTEDAQENIQLVLGTLKSFGCGQKINIILDCVLVSAGDALKAVQKIQYNLPILGVKVDTLAVICNDIEIFDFSAAFSSVFRIAPLNYSPKQLQMLYRSTEQLAIYYRYFAWSSIARLFRRIYLKIRSFKK